MIPGSLAVCVTRNTFVVSFSGGPLAANEHLLFHASRQYEAVTVCERYYRLIATLPPGGTSPWSVYSVYARQMTRPVVGLQLRSRFRLATGGSLGGWIVIDSIVGP